MSQLEKLVTLYGQCSKHSNYQILPENLARVLGEGAITVQSRYERERLKFILKHVTLRGKKILDIGGNTGFFTFEALEAGAHSVHHYEGNQEHSEFVRTAAKLLGYTDRVEVTNAYHDFNFAVPREYDVVFLLNVLHHLGDDFGGAKMSVEAAKREMIVCLNNLAAVTDCLVLQIGFCWKGDRNSLMFPGGSKKELIDFVAESSKDVWEIETIGIPVKTEKQEVEYQLMVPGNSSRDDSLGEFLNRPLLILRRA